MTLQVEPQLEAERSDIELENDTNSMTLKFAPQLVVERVLKVEPRCA
jgi:hypothetical protein